ncbi:hypothetical protein HPB52_011514 [Rhipicephalus sanguineus]|uniref:Uncharacterized protein n=1 Tax=Rhipicephalus sanguineus TaxID=34632 RepID=A0A9D4YNG1_RHISA|nr:hypothetical protein HPB52_011514 [Rhipicephalus sanguineus]
MSELHNDHLLQLIEKLKEPVEERRRNVEDMHSLYKASLVNNDPVVCALFFDKTRPAPQEDLSDDMPCSVALVNRLMSPGYQPSLSASRDNTRKVCRFNAPFWPMSETRILTPTLKHEGNTLELKALREKYKNMHCKLEEVQYASIDEFWQNNGIATEEEYIRVLKAGITPPHNLCQERAPPAIPSVLNSNMDLQLIVDAYSCAAYVVDYVNKPNRGFSNLHTALADIEKHHPNLALGKLVAEPGVRVLNGVEISTLEAAWILLRLGMSDSSRQIAFIPTMHPDERVRVRKQQRELQDEDDDSTDVWKLNVVQKYEDRPEEMADVCLADFVAHYTYNHQRGEYRRRKVPRIIRYRAYRKDDTDDFMREMVTLFHPSLYETHLDQIVAKKKQFEGNISGEDLKEMCRELLQQNVIEHQQQEQVVVREESVLSVDRAENVDIAHATSACGAGNTCSERSFIARSCQIGNPSESSSRGQQDAARTFTVNLLKDTYTGSILAHVPQATLMSLWQQRGRPPLLSGASPCTSALKITMKKDDGGLRHSDLNTYRCVFRDVKAILVDEVSMMGSEVLVKVDDRLRLVGADVRKKHTESLRNKYQAMHQALEMTDSMAQFWEHPGIMDKAE